MIRKHRRRHGHNGRFGATTVQRRVLYHIAVQPAAYAAPRHSPKGAFANVPTRVPANVPARVPAGVKRNFSNSTLRVRDARGYGPEIGRGITSECTRPRPAGVSGIIQFLLLRVRGRTRVRSRDRPGNHQLSYPPASRGREWNFSIPLSPRARTHAGTIQRTTSKSPAFVPARVPRA